MRQRAQQRSGTETALLYGTRAAILLVLAMPLMVRIELFFPYVVGKALYFRTLTEIAFALWVVLAYRYAAYRPSRFVILGIFAVYLAVSLLAAVFGVSFQRSVWSTYERMQGVLDLAHWLAFVLVAASVFRSFTDWRALLNVSLGFSLLISLIGVVQYYELFEIPGYEFLEATGRLDVTLGNATYVGAYMLVSVLVAVGLLAQSYRDGRETAPPVEESAALRRRRRRRRREAQRPQIDWTPWSRGFWAAVVVFGLWVMALSGARGAVIGLVMSVGALALLFAAWESSRRVRIAAMVCLAMVVGGVVLFTAARNTAPVDRVAESVTMVHRLRKISLDDTSIRPRVLSWQAGLRGFAEKPILGWGPENFIVIWGRHLDPTAQPSEIHDQAHSKPVEELSTKGALGLAAYLALWGAMMWVLYRRVRHRDHPEQRLILFVGATAAGYFIQNLFLFDTPATVLSFMVLLAYVVRLEQEDAPSAAPGDAPARRGATARDEEPDIGWYAAIGLATAAVVAAFVLVNAPTYRAAEMIAQASIPDLPWDLRAEIYENSIEEFGFLASQPRLRLLNQVHQNWQGMSPQQKADALAMAKRHGELLLEKEPEDWLTYVNLATVYQTAWDIDPVNVERAAEYLETALELAPGPVGTSGLVQRQAEIEALLRSRAAP